MKQMGQHLNRLSAKPFNYRMHSVPLSHSESVLSLHAGHESKQTEHLGRPYPLDFVVQQTPRIYT